jgi:hypothetical protein
MSPANGSADTMSRTSRRNAHDVTAALRMRRYRERKNNNENKASVTVDAADSLTISTAQMAGLAARLGDGRASRQDMELADKVIMAFVMSLPPDSVVEIGANEIPDDNEPEYPGNGG